MVDRIEKIALRRSIWWKKGGVAMAEGEPAFFALFAVFALLVLLAIGANLGWFGPTM